jgi:hypothetical protein
VKIVAIVILIGMLGSDVLMAQTPPPGNAKTPSEPTTVPPETKDESTMDTVKKKSGEVLEKSKEVLKDTRDYAEEKYEEYESKNLSSWDNRAIDNIRVGVAPWIPGTLYPLKRGFIVDYSIDENNSVGGEYQSGGFKVGLFNLQFGEFKEQLYLIPYKSFTGNSFYWKAGLGLRKYRVSLGDKILDTIGTVTGHDLGSIRILEVQNEVLLVGVGNEWQFDPGFYWGVDWLELFVPIGQGKVKDDVSDLLPADEGRLVRKAIDYMEKKISLNILKIKVGWAF